ncbi:MAG: HPr-rel-A system PqqD family peptide chaperone [Sphingomonadales bacterium]|nr:HPr-rel-A system PqqD family peptide chaperone [Sphingomonadales bacterium]
MRYRADPPALLQIVPLDSLTAIYHRRSGQTHLVAEPVPEILAALGEGGDLTDILAQLGLQDAPDAREALAARLDEMIATGLVTAS